MYLDKHSNEAYLLDNISFVTVLQALYDGKIMYCKWVEDFQTRFIIKIQEEKRREAIQTQV